MENHSSNFSALLNTCGEGCRPAMRKYGSQVHKKAYKAETMSWADVLRYAH
jgi:hypothetical protein